MAKRKKYADGGRITDLLKKMGIDDPTSLDISNMKGMMSSGVADAVGNIGSSVLSGMAKSTISSTDPRANPAIAMKKANALNTASGILSATAKGAAAGSVVPGIGTLVGAGAGLLTSGVEALIGAKGKRKAINDATGDWADANTAGYQDAMAEKSYADGGDVGLKLKVPKLASDNPGLSSGPDDAKGMISLQTVYRNQPNYLTRTNAVDKAIQYGYAKVEQRDYYLKSSPEEFNKIIPEGSNLAYNKAPKGKTANPGGWQYTDTSHISQGTDIYKGTKKIVSNATKVDVDKYSPKIYPTRKENTGIESKAKGGTIKGPGTGKSDSVNMSADEGSFVVPSENAAKARTLGEQYLGWKKGQSDDKKGDTAIKASNDEVIFSPEEAEILKFHGVDLNKLAPKAGDTQAKKKGGAVKGYKNGKWVRNGENFDYIEDPDSTESAPTDQNLQHSGSDATGTVNTGSVKTDPVKVGGAPSQKEEPKFGFAEVAGMFQAIGGAAGLASAKRQPDLNVSATLKSLSAETRRQAAYGLDPTSMNVLNNSIERSRRDTNALISGKGGSGQEMMAGLNTALQTTIAGKEDLAVKDVQEQNRKFQNVMNVDSQIGSQEFEVSRMKREDWYKSQDAFAGLLSSGIENIIGARQFRDQQKTNRLRSNTPTIKFG